MHSLVLGICNKITRRFCKTRPYHSSNEYWRSKWGVGVLSKYAADNGKGYLLDILPELNCPAEFDFAWLKATVTAMALTNQPPHLFWSHPEVRCWMHHFRHSIQEHTNELVELGICLNYWPGDNDYQYLPLSFPYRNQTWFNPTPKKLAAFHHYHDWSNYALTLVQVDFCNKLPVPWGHLPNAEALQPLITAATVMFKQRPGKFLGKDFPQTGWDLCNTANWDSKRYDLHGLFGCHFLKRARSRNEFECILPWSPQLLFILSQNEVNALLAPPR